MTSQSSSQPPIDQLIYLVSHALRGPVTNLRWGLELLEGESLGSLNTEQKELIGDLSTRTSELNIAIGAMITLSRVKQGAITPQLSSISLTPLITEIVSSLERDLAARKFSCKIINMPEHTITGDPDMMRTVLNSLLSACHLLAGSNSSLQLETKTSHDKTTIIIQNQHVDKKRAEDADLSPAGTAGLLFHLAEELSTQLGCSLENKGENGSCRMELHLG